MADGRPVRTLLLIVMDVLVVLAVVLVARTVVVFFGVLASAAWGKSIVSLTHSLLVPFGIKAITTPYGGSFDVNAALTVVLLLTVEWALSIARRAS